MILGKKKAAKKTGAAVTARHYEVIQSPVITEKSTAQSESGKFVFNVSLDASKIEVKDAIEALFNVKVVKVNTLNRKGKSKQFRGTLGRRPDTKKAVVTLESGSSIDIAAGAR